MRFPRTRSMNPIRTVHALRSLKRGDAALVHLSVMGMTHVSPSVRPRIAV